MTIPLHPLQTTNLIRNSYIRYLKTIYPFQDRELRREFWQALEQPDMVVKGPLLEASPPFKAGRSLDQLVTAGVLHPDFRRLRSPDLPLDRPLYLHQEQAILKVVQEQRNLIVATGTGSGKTETFLIPIIDHLLRERAEGRLGPGVRALLLYPMNALANDQLKRLRRLLANCPDITFGRYTGETQETDAKAIESFREQFRDEPMLPNELISRRQLRARPPHLLLTNYAMLEYLLLRPLDNEFFDGETAHFWRFIVLDEAHVYDGASGIEIAMLLRRLKERVVRSERGRLRCLATSATLGGPNDYPAAVQFAGDLFNETFQWEPDNPAQQDVVRASRVSPAALGPTWGQGSPALYAALGQALRGSEPIPALINAAQKHGAPSAVIHEIRQHSSVAAEPVNACLYYLLRGDQRLRLLQETLQEQPRFLNQLAETIFPGQAEASESLVALVDLAVRARPASNALSLLPARYHVFARALEGAFACLHHEGHPAAAGAPPQLFLTRHEKCPHCQSQVLEIATCARCGVVYIAAQLVRGQDEKITYVRQLSYSDDSRIEKTYFVLDEELAGLDEDEAVAAEEDPGLVIEDQLEPYTLCLHCGAIEAGRNIAPPCRCSAKVHRVVYRVDLQGKPELTRCVTCGSRSSAGIIYRFQTGQDAPVSVLATALYQNLPPASDDKLMALPGEGRKLLAFADNRQDAAFFAPYMEQTYNQILRRRLLLKTLVEDPEGRLGQLRLQDLTGRLLRQTEAIGLFTEAQSPDERRRLMNTWLMQELVSLDRRLSLEGLGFIHFRLVRPKGWTPPQPLLEPPWNLSEEEAWNLLALLIDTLRQQAAVVYPDGVEPTAEVFAPRNRAFYVRRNQAEAKQSLYSWLPSRGSNRRLDILLKLVDRQSDLPEGEKKKIAGETLGKLWDILTGPGSAWRDHLQAETVRSLGTVHRFNYRFWEVVPVQEAGLAAYRCNRCRNVSYLNLRGVCPSYRCQGRLEPLDTNAPGLVENHYRYLYQFLIPIPFSAQEHTAQWRNTTASEVQEQFVRGEVNALSCSTTFELGVDVGELQAVLMRNVPPTTANYVQRAGRAGRRTDSAAFALTYAQRRSHDLAHYAKPQNLVAGKIKPPVIVVNNEKIVRRHVHSVLFAAFFRRIYQKEGHWFGNVGAFFEASPISGPQLLREYAEQHPAEVAEALKRIVPESLQAELGLAEWRWLGRLWQVGEPAPDDPLPILDVAAGEVGDDLQILRQMEDEAIKERNYRRADHYQNVAKTVRSRDLLGFLGSRNVLPKYGFPSDVVELRTDFLQLPEAQQVELERDLRVAISEYAPGGEVVAAKRIWVSGGVYKRAGRDWPVYNYAVCPGCHRFYHSLGDISKVCEVCGANVYSSAKDYGTFIIPEFGFIVAHEEPRKSGESRPQRLYSSWVYFADYTSPHQRNESIKPEYEPFDPLCSASAQLWTYYSRYGLLALVNSGTNKSGFIVCQVCGAAKLAAKAERPKRGSKPNPHTNPRTGRQCNGRTNTFHLGHRFITDVLELQFRGRITNNPAYAQNDNLWRSVLFALLEGASEVLGIRRDDLDGTLQRRTENPLPSLFLFDNVPGGAGHVHRISQELVSTFQAAYRRVARCECGEETSCYECLRNYQNRFHHDQLQRGLARDFLKNILEAAGVFNPGVSYGPNDS